MQDASVATWSCVLPMPPRRGDYQIRVRWIKVFCLAKRPLHPPQIGSRQLFPVRQMTAITQGCVTAFVSRKPTEAVTTEIQNRNSINPAHLPIADVCSFRVHALVFF